MTLISVTAILMPYSCQLITGEVQFCCLAADSMGSFVKWWGAVCAGLLVFDSRRQTSSHPSSEMQREHKGHGMACDKYARWSWDKYLIFLRNENSKSVWIRCQCNSNACFQMSNDGPPGYVTCGKRRMVMHNMAWHRNNKCFLCTQLYSIQMFLYNCINPSSDV